MKKNGAYICLSVAASVSRSLAFPAKAAAKAANFGSGFSDLTIRYECKPNTQDMILICAPN